jgi:hypothetical protein
MSGAADVFVIWYGCWDDNCGNFGNTNTQEIVRDFLSNVGGSPYFQINAMYANGSGQAPSGATFYSGEAYDRYSHGLELTATDIAGIVENQIVTGSGGNLGGNRIRRREFGLNWFLCAFSTPASWKRRGIGIGHSLCVRWQSKSLSDRGSATVLFRRHSVTNSK